MRDAWPSRIHCWTSFGGGSRPGLWAGTDIYGVPETMATLAGQLGKPFKDFVSKYEYFDRRREQRSHSIQDWRATHRRLADAHERWREQISADADWSDSAWLHHRLEETCHRLCSDPSGSLPSRA
nr:hypothetical protein GCM10020092_054910 [Actinoplanes digitatis]